MHRQINIHYIYTTNPNMFAVSINVYSKKVEVNMAGEQKPKVSCNR